MVSTESRVLSLLATVVQISALTPLERVAFERLDINLVTEWVRFIFPELKNNPGAGQSLRDFLDRVSGSEHSLADWLQRVIVTYRWLQAQSRRAHLCDIVDYAACSLHGTEHPDGQDVEWYLEQFGFERSWLVG